MYFIKNKFSNINDLEFMEMTYMLNLKLEFKFSSFQVFNYSTFQIKFSSFQLFKFSSLKTFQGERGYTRGGARWGWGQKELYGGGGQVRVRAKGITRWGIVENLNSSIQLSSLTLLASRKGSSIEEFYQNMETASREWRPRWAPTND
jgi:hypothetical protein